MQRGKCTAHTCGACCLRVSRSSLPGRAHAASQQTCTGPGRPRSSSDSCIEGWCRLSATGDQELSLASLRKRMAYQEKRLIYSVTSSHMYRQNYTSVYVNCWTTSRIMVEHSRHWNVPITSSGRTSDVRVTVPRMLVNFPMQSVRRSRILLGNDDAVVRVDKLWNLAL